MRRVACQVVLAIVFAATAANSSSADGFSFSLHSGHHHHHRHHHCWGPHYGFSIWSPPPPRYVYVAPPPVIQERIYVQPPVQERVIIQQQAPVGSTTTTPPAITSNPLPAPPTRAASTGAPVVIRNSNGKGASVAFLIDEKSEELRDGQTRTYSGSSHVVEFDRGGNLGTARYEVTGGLYSFAVSDEGWELIRESNNATRTADRPALRKNELPVSVSR